MSLIDRFSPRTLRIGLSAERFVSVVYRGGSCDSDSVFKQNLKNPSGDWKPLLNLLAERLDSQAGEGSGDVSVVVSGNWCRMMMVPWSDALLKKETTSRFLGSQFVSLYGDDAHDWSITTDDVAYGRPRLACAINGQFLRSLREILGARKQRCRSVEPVLSSAWRAISAASTEDVRAFAVVEDGRLMIACAVRGEITAIHSQGCGDDWANALLGAWQRWGLRAPSISEIKEVLLLNLRTEAVEIQLPAPFKFATSPSFEVDPALRFVTCGGSA